MGTGSLKAGFKLQFLHHIGFIFKAHRLMLIFNMSYIYLLENRGKYLEIYSLTM